MVNAWETGGCCEVDEELQRGGEEEQEGWGSLSWSAWLVVPRSC